MVQVKMKSENGRMHQPKHNKDLETRPDAAYVHKAPVTTKRKDQHGCVSSHDHGQKGKSRKSKVFEKDCLSNVVSSHLKRGSFELAKTRSRGKIRA